MLKILRKKKNVKRIFWAMIILIVPAFMLWGSGSVIKGRREAKYAGKIFGKKIPLKEYMESLQACRIQAKMRYGDKFEQMAEYLDLNREAWRRLILLGEAKRRRIKVTDKQVIDFIRKLVLFKKNGEFDRNLYNSLLDYFFRISPRAFEEQIRKTLMISKLYNLISEEVSLKDEEVEQEYKKLYEQAKVSYVLFETEKFKDEIKLDEQEIKVYFKQHSHEFKKPEQVNVEYVGIDYAQLEAEVEILEEEIKEYYNAHREEFKLTDDSSLLEEDNSSVPADETEYRPLEEVKEEIRKKLLLTETRKLAKKRIGKIAFELRKSRNFEKVVNDYSLQKRETGFFALGEPIPGIGWSYQFSKVAFRLKSEEFSQITETSKGYYILRIKQRKQPYIPSLGEVREKVELAWKDRQAKQLARKVANEFLSKIKEIIADSKVDFFQATKELGLHFHETPLFRRGSYVPGIGTSKGFFEAAFNLSVGEISEVIQTQKGFCILRLDEFVPIDETKFLKEKEEFSKRLLSQKREENFLGFLLELEAKADLQSYIPESS